MEKEPNISSPTHDNNYGGHDAIYTWIQQKLSWLIKRSTNKNIVKFITVHMFGSPPSLVTTTEKLKQTPKINTISD